MIEILATILGAVLGAVAISFCIWAAYLLVPIMIDEVAAARREKQEHESQEKGDGDE